MATVNKEVLLKNDPALKNRPYQEKAIQSILLEQKCLVKMFCGTGKSLIITKVIIHEKKELSVVVFPSLALIQQYWNDYVVKYFSEEKYARINVSSLKEKKENGKEITIKSETKPNEIKKFLKGKSPKIVLVTYHSFEVLLNCLEGQKIGIVCYDEAHHVTSPETQKLVFGTVYYEKEVFFTATPKNENGITMFDRDDPAKSMCGPVAYEYTYLQALYDATGPYVNEFEICIDMYTENTNASIYEAMSRAILTKGTSRVLTFHSGVLGESNTDVKNFVKETEFQAAFDKVLKNEFPEKARYYTKITFKGMDGKTPPKVRKAMLKALYATPDNEIYIIASCETMGEGVDTNKANMCVFADPKSSITKIIQNIGRVVRPNPECPVSTILIPCWVNMENYAAANGDRAKQDELIRQQMRSEKGDYASILNVLGALRQEDPEIYDKCLNYSDNREDVDADFDEEESVSEAESDSASDTEDRRPNKRIRMSINQNDDIQMLWGVKGGLDFSQKFCSVVIECEIVKIDPMEVAIAIVERANARESNGENLLPRDLYRITERNEVEKQEYSDYIKLRNWKRKNYLSIKLINYLNENLCGWNYIRDTIEEAIYNSKLIVERARLRESNGQNLLPKNYRGDECTSEEQLEKKDSMRLGNWSNGLAVNNKVAIFIKPYLDEFLPGWNDDLDSVAMKYVISLVQRAKERQIKGLNLLPRYRPKNQYPNLSEEQIQENSDKAKLGSWDNVLNGTGQGRCSDDIHKYLNEHLPGWRETLDDKCIKEVKELIKRAKTRETNGGDLLPKQFHHIPKKERTSAQNIEYKDAQKLKNIKRAIENPDKKNGRISKNVIELLDKNLPRWNESLNDIAIKFAHDIIKRANLRKESGRKLLPTSYSKPSNCEDTRTDEQKQEKHDDTKLRNWRSALGGSKNQVCCDEVRDLLDSNLPKWRELKGQAKKQPVPEPTQPEAPPPKKRTIKIKKQTAIPIATTTATETTTPNHFPPPSEIGLLHKTYLKMRSDTLNAKFKSEPQLWLDYHATRKRNFATYDPASIPSNQIIRELEKIQTKRQKVVVDMGCGEAPIAHHFQNKNDNRFTFHNYDHQSGGDPLIQEVDISALPLDDASVEIGIMSLALWGTRENCTQYIKEAYRVLESGGLFYISDSTKKWSPEPLTPENGGELLRTLLTENGFKIIGSTLGSPFCLFVCNKL